MSLLAALASMVARPSEHGGLRTLARQLTVALKNPEMLVSSSAQLRSLIGSLVTSISTTGQKRIAAPYAETLADLRAFNYERIYNRPESLAPGESVVKVLTALVEKFIESPELLADGGSAEDAVVVPVTYVAGITDRFAFESATPLLGWSASQLPRGISAPSGAEGHVGARAGLMIFVALPGEMVRTSERVQRTHKPDGGDLRSWRTLSKAAARISTAVST